MLKTREGHKADRSSDRSPDTSDQKLFRTFGQLPFTLYKSVRTLFSVKLPVAIKLAIAMGILLTIAMGLLGALIVQDQTRLMNRQSHSNGRIVISQMAESTKEPLLAEDILQLEVLAYNLTSAKDVLGTTIYSADHKVLARSGYNPFDINAPLEAQHKSYLQGSLQSLEWQWEHSPVGSIDAISFMSPVRFKDVTVGHVLISFSRDTITQAIHDAVKSIITVTSFLIALGIIISYILGHRLTRPIQHLINATKAIGKGEYHYRIDERRNDEIGYLMNSFNSMAQGMLQKDQVEKAFTRHVSPNIAREIMKNLEEVKLGGTHVFSSVLFVDIVGFTSASETMTPSEVAGLLNDFYGYTTHSAPLYKGTIDKFIGDCAMVVFGVPEPDEDHVFHSLAYGVFLQKLTEKLNQIRKKRNQPPIHFRIGVNAGEMLAGNMGSETRMQYTVVGDSVNLASRLCSSASKNQILITEEIYNHPGLRTRIVATQHKSIYVRGKSQPISMYQVLDVEEPYRSKMEKEIELLIKSSAGDSV